jgi:hypothetical protein
MGLHEVIVDAVEIQMATGDHLARFLGTEQTPKNPFLPLSPTCNFGHDRTRCCHVMLLFANMVARPSLMSSDGSRPS